MPLPAGPRSAMSMGFVPTFALMPAGLAIPVVGSRFSTLTVLLAELATTRFIWNVLKLSNVTAEGAWPVDATVLGEMAPLSEPLSVRTLSEACPTMKMKGPIGLPV